VEERWKMCAGHVDAIREDDQRLLPRGLFMIGGGPLLRSHQRAAWARHPVLQLAPRGVSP